jgi:hypothetical protein
VEGTGGGVLELMKGGYFPLGLVTGVGWVGEEECERVELAAWVVDLL